MRAERLSLTLRYLATGNSQVTAVLTMYIFILLIGNYFDVQVSLSFNFRVGRSTVCGILRETCAALWSALKPKYVTPPSTKNGWINVSLQFEKIWNFPNCLGMLKTSHINFMCKCLESLNFTLKVL